MNTTKRCSLYLVFAVILASFHPIFSKGRTSYRKIFSALVLCISIYLFGYLMIINDNLRNDGIDSISGLPLFQYYG